MLRNVNDKLCINPLEDRPLDVPESEDWNDNKCFAKPCKPLQAALQTQQPKQAHTSGSSSPVSSLISVDCAILHNLCQLASLIALKISSKHIVGTRYLTYLKSGKFCGSTINSS